MSDVPPPGGGLYEAVRALFGAGGTTLIVAGLGRLVWHGQEVSAGRRPLLGRHLIWEIPTAVGMAFVGEALGTWLGAPPSVTTGIVAVLSYLGPRGARDLLERLLPRPPKT